MNWTTDHTSLWGNFIRVDLTRFSGQLKYFKLLITFGLNITTSNTKQTAQSTARIRQSKCTKNKWNIFLCSLQLSFLGRQPVPSCLVFWWQTQKHYDTESIIRLPNCVASLGYVTRCGFNTLLHDKFGRGAALCMPEVSQIWEHIRGCIQKFPDWPPGARTASGTALWH